MAQRRWTVLPGGRVTRWKKSRGEWRPGGWPTGSWPCPPHWYRNSLNRRERRAIREALYRGEANAAPYVHPTTAAWWW